MQYEAGRGWPAAHPPRRSPSAAEAMTQAASQPRLWETMATEWHGPLLGTVQGLGRPAPRERPPSAWAQRTPSHPPGLLPEARGGPLGPTAAGAGAATAADSPPCGSSGACYAEMAVEICEEMKSFEQHKETYLDSNHLRELLVHASKSAPLHGPYQLGRPSGSPSRRPSPTHHRSGGGDASAHHEWHQHLQALSPAAMYPWPSPTQPQYADDTALPHHWPEQLQRSQLCPAQHLASRAAAAAPDGPWQRRGPQPPAYAGTQPARHTSSLAELSVQQRQPSRPRQPILHQAWVAPAGNVPLVSADQMYNPHVTAQQASASRVPLQQQREQSLPRCLVAPPAGPSLAPHETPSVGGSWTPALAGDAQAQRRAASPGADGAGLAVRSTSPPGAAAGAALPAGAPAGAPLPSQGPQPARRLAVGGSPVLPSRGLSMRGPSPQRGRLMRTPPASPQVSCRLVPSMHSSKSTSCLRRSPSPALASRALGSSHSLTGAAPPPEATLGSGKLPSAATAAWSSGLAGDAAMPACAMAPALPRSPSGLLSGAPCAATAAPTPASWLQRCPTGTLLGSRKASSVAAPSTAALSRCACEGAKGPPATSPNAKKQHVSVCAAVLEAPLGQVPGRPPQRQQPPEAAPSQAPPRAEDRERPPCPPAELCWEALEHVVQLKDALCTVLSEPRDIAAAKAEELPGECNLREVCDLLSRSLSSLQKELDTTGAGAARGARAAAARDSRLPSQVQVQTSLSSAVVGVQDVAAEAANGAARRAATPAVPTAPALAALAAADLAA